MIDARRRVEGVVVTLSDDPEVELAGRVELRLFGEGIRGQEHADAFERRGNVVPASVCGLCERVGQQFVFDGAQIRVQIRRDIVQIVLIHWLCCPWIASFPTTELQDPAHPSSS